MAVEHTGMLFEVHDCGLPTLSHYEKKLINNEYIIEAENLNPYGCDGVFVSPNTIRNYPNGLNISLKMIHGEVIPKDIRSKIDANRYR